jgi:hypothetical protein
MISAMCNADYLKFQAGGGSEKEAGGDPRNGAGECKLWYLQATRRRMITAGRTWSVIVSDIDDVSRPLKRLLARGACGHGGEKFFMNDQNKSLCLMSS